MGVAPMKVYEVHRSDYDIHQIYFICSTREKAEKAIDLFWLEHGNSERLCIEEWEVDDLSNYISSERIKNHDN